MPFENSWLFPAVESVHVIGLAAFVGTVVLEDVRALGLGIPDTRGLKPWTHGGLAVMLLTGAVMFLSAAASDFMTGQTINVDGGKAMH